MNPVRPAPPLLTVQLFMVDLASMHAHRDVIVMFSRHLWHASQESSWKCFSDREDREASAPPPTCMLGWEEDEEEEEGRRATVACSCVGLSGLQPACLPTCESSTSLQQRTSMKSDPDRGGSSQEGAEAPSADLPPAELRVIERRV